LDHFQIFDLPRRLRLDETALQRRFYELSRQWHPDFHHQASAGDQARALEASARLNTAYRALRDPLGRVEYLVRLERGRETKEGAAVKPAAPPDLLEEMFDIQEALAEAKAVGLDEGARATLQGHREGLEARLREHETRLTGPLSEAWDTAAAGDRPRALDALEQALAARAYLRTVIADLDEALGDTEGTGRHVSHHRH
jgi:molecular chaperone HscB